MIDYIEQIEALIKAMKSKSPHDKPERLLSRSELCTQIGITEYQFKKLEKECDIPYYDFGLRSKRYRLSEILPIYKKSTGGNRKVINKASIDTTNRNGKMIVKVES